MLLGADLAWESGDPADDPATADDDGNGGGPRWLPHWAGDFRAIELDDIRIRQAGLPPLDIAMLRLVDRGAGFDAAGGWRARPN